MLKTRLMKAFALFSLALTLLACQSNKPEQLVTWGYVTGDPILDAGHEGNFYPQAVDEGQVAE